MEAGYRPVLTGCLPLKCYFFYLFSKNIVFCYFLVLVLPLDLAVLRSQNPDASEFSKDITAF